MPLRTTMRALLALLAVIPVAARAQQATTITTALPAAAGLSAADSARLVSDVFLGRGVVGPYLLTWKGIESGSLVVIRDGQQLARDADYRVDCAAGTLVFAEPLRARQIARADYVAVPGKAQPNSTPLGLPLQFSLFDQGSGALTLNALFKPVVPGQASSAGSLASAMLLSFGGNAKLAGQSTLTSRLLLDARGGSLLDRSGLQIAEKTKARYGQFSVSLSRAGAGFRGAQEAGFAAGRQALEAAASLNPIHGLQASASFTQVTELPEQGRGATVTTLGQKLTGLLTPSTRLLATHTDTTTHPAEGDAATRVTDRVQVDQRVGARTQASALVERTEAASGDTRAVSETNKLTVRSQPTSTMTVQGTYTNQLLPSGATDSTNLRVDADPTKRVRLSAGLSDTFTSTSALHTRDASVQYQAMSAMALNGSVQMRSEGAREGLVGGMGATVRPNRYLEMIGGVRLRSGLVGGLPDPDAYDTYDLKVAVRLPWSRLHLTGGFTDNPEDERGVASRGRARSVGLQSTMGPLDLSGGYTLQSDLATVRTNTALDLKLGWRLARATQLVTAYRQTQAFDTSILATDTYTLSFSQRVGSSLDFTLSGTLTTYQRDRLPQPDEDLKAEAKLGLKF